MRKFNDKESPAILIFIDNLDMDELSSDSGNRCDEDTRDALYHAAGLTGCYINPETERAERPSHPEVTGDGIDINGITNE